MNQGSGTRWRRARLAAAGLALAVVVILAWLGVGSPAPGEGAAGVVTGDALFFMRIPTLSTALQWTAAAREDVPALDKALSAARDTLGYDLLDPDTWRGLAVDLDGPFSVALVPAPPLSAVLVLSIPIHPGTPALTGVDLLFAHIPIEERPRLEQGYAQDATLVRLLMGGRVRGILVEWESRVFVALPVGPGDREAGLDGWIARTTDPDGVRLVTRAGVRDALRANRDAPLLVLCREDENAPPCVQTPEDPVAEIGRMFELLLD